MGFAGASEKISETLAAKMRGVSYHERLGEFTAPPIESLRLLRVTHFGFDGSERSGELVVAERIASRVLAVFREVHAARFPIEKMRLIDEYGGSDEASMTDNNSSAFNCRLISGTDRVSSHARGIAIDINPMQNPYITGGRVQPAGADAYVNREQEHPGLLRANGAVVCAFLSAGFSWGGHWQEPLDYHHFQYDG